jgi:hypothetical protein
MRRLAAIVLLASAICSSCRTIRVIEQVPVKVHDTAYVSKVMHDSTYIDRWHTVEVDGDTVYVTEQQIVSKWRTITDTAYKYIEKPVTVTVEQIKEVERELTKWQKFRLSAFWWLSAGLIGFILWKSRHLWLTLFRW